MSQHAQLCETCGEPRSRLFNVKEVTEDNLTTETSTRRVLRVLGVIGMVLGVIVLTVCAAVGALVLIIAGVIAW